MRITHSRILESVRNPASGGALFLALGAPSSAHPLDFGPYHYVVLGYSTLLDLDLILWKVQALPGIRGAYNNFYIYPATCPSLPRTFVRVSELRSRRWDTFYYLPDNEYGLLKRITETTDADWEWTDEAFIVEADSMGLCSGGTAPVHRLEYRAQDGYFTQYYTQDLAVCGRAKSELGLIPRGTPFWATPANGGADNPCFAPYRKPVFRLYNNREGEGRPNHRYLTNSVLAAQLVQQGWTNEGIGFCAYP